MKKLLFSALVGLTFIACNRTEDYNPENSSMERSYNIEGRTSENANNAKRTPAQEGLVSIVIFEFSIGRESKGCKGFGICDFEWFPGFGRVTNGDNFDRAEVWKYADGTYDLEFYINEEVADPADPSLSIIVDSDLVSGLTPDGDRLYIKSGTYAFDASLGENGGYNIPVFEYN